VRVKYSCEKRRWQFDWNGVPEAEAAKHGYRPLPRPVAPPPPPPDPAYARAVRDRAAAATWEAKRAAKAKAAKKAASLERQRIRRRLYFAGYYAANRERIAARRAEARRGRPLSPDELAARAGARAALAGLDSVARKARRAALSRERSTRRYARLRQMVFARHQMTRPLG
jgi:hypothetical protein